MAFEAKWDGWCSECDEKFGAGDYIDRSDLGYRHAGVCPAQQPRRVGEVCAACFVERALNGSCGCAA